MTTLSQVAEDLLALRKMLGEGDIFQAIFLLNNLIEKVNQEFSSEKFGSECGKSFSEIEGYGGTISWNRNPWFLSLERRAIDFDRKIAEFQTPVDEDSSTSK